MEYEIYKFPRTPHLEGSRLQVGDDPSMQTLYEELAGRFICVAEKMDGGQGGLHFNSNADLLLQSRGHYLTGGWRERHFNRFKTWAAQHQDALFDKIGDQFLLFCEDCSCKHTVFYNVLPHYFLEFDLYDRTSQSFLSTAARSKVLTRSPVLSVPVLYSGPAPATLTEFLKLIKPWSLAKQPGWEFALCQEAEKAGVDPERSMRETWMDNGPEGLYIKVEEGDRVVGRYKWVRSGFLQTITDNDNHWLNRPIIRNLVVDGADLDAAALQVTWENLPFLPNKGNLLSRNEFREAVFRRDGGRCVFCGKLAVDAHHVLDRGLFADAGYYLANGVSACAKCHLDCEESRISVEQARKAARIEVPVLAPGIFPSQQYDKWGKIRCT